MLTATSNNGNDAYSDGMDELAWYTSAETPSPMATTTGRVEQNFPTVLHHVLAQLEREGKAHIAGFLSHGRAFKVFKPREFVDEVLTPYVMAKRSSCRVSCSFANRRVSPLLSVPQLVPANQIFFLSATAEHLRFYSHQYRYAWNLMLGPSWSIQSILTIPTVSFRNRRKRVLPQVLRSRQA
jgi:hypothetical protein